MSQLQEKTAVAGWLGGVLAGVIGVVVGFIYGFLFVVAPAMPFANDEATRGWALGIGLLVGGGSAIVGGLVGTITGTIFGVQAIVKALATNGILAGLIGVVLGFLAGVMANGLLYGVWEALSDPSVNFAFLGGALGIITGTILGARDAVRKQRVRGRWSCRSGGSGGDGGGV
jgi:hypothetical protein